MLVIVYLFFEGGGALRIQDTILVSVGNNITIFGAGTHTAWPRKAFLLKPFLPFGFLFAWPCGKHGSRDVCDNTLQVKGERERGRGGGKRQKRRRQKGVVVVPDNKQKLC